MTEVYEVATFYHHFDVVKEGEAPPPALTVRVCETLSCQMAGARRAARRARAALRAGRARHRRALHRPLRARAGRGRRPQSGRPRDAGSDRGRRRGERASSRRFPRYIDYAAYRAARRLPRARVMRRAASAPLEDGDRDDGGLGAARPGRRRLSGGPQVADRARRAGAAAHGGQHRRRRARDVQGPPLPRARSASLPRRHADRRVGGRHRRRLRLSARRIRGVPRDPRRARSRRSRPIRRARCRASTCGAAPAPTSAAKSRR